MTDTATILLVDDEVLITEMVADALSDSGFDVVVANDGAEAMALLAARRIDALITDINMGSGADGWAVARCARRCSPRVPVVYTTGGAANEWEAHGVPGSILVVKPFIAPAVVSAVTGLLGR